MNYQSYTDIVNYLRAKVEGREAFPLTFTSRQKRNFRMKVKSYSLNGSKLTRTGQETLHENNIEDTLRRIHEEDLEHTGDCKVLQQKCLEQYHAENLRGYCQDVTVTCLKCQEKRMVILDIVPMYHLSHKTRANICQTLMMPVKTSKNRKRTRKSLVPIFAAGDRPVHTQDYVHMDPDIHEPIRIDCVQDKSSCFLDCVHYLITGKKKPSTRLQKVLTIWRKEESDRVGSFYYPYNDPDIPLLERGVTDPDIHIVAEKLGVHVYEYRSDINPPQWYYVAGHKRGRGGTEVQEAIYLYYSVGVGEGGNDEGHTELIVGRKTRRD